MADRKYTVVRHSGYGYNQNPEFERGLEPRSLATAKDVRKVEKAGGKVFTDYAEADDYADQQMYPDNQGMIPHAPGTFAEVSIDGLEVYVPPAAPATT